MSAAAHGEKQIMLKVILGFGLGLFLSIFAQAGRYVFDPKGHFPALWTILELLSKPVMGYGAWHFAKQRGYTGGAGVGLFVVAVIVALVLILSFGPPRGQLPFVFVFFDLFYVGFPVAVLLALPRKNFKPKRAKSRSRN
jgi:apolipoprotein N-acyltransferase